MGGRRGKETHTWERGAGFVDAERRWTGKYAYRYLRIAEEESYRLVLTNLLEGNFISFFLFLPIHPSLQNLLELLLQAKGQCAPELRERGAGACRWTAWEPRVSPGQLTNDFPLQCPLIN